ncbi:NB-ARC domain disease resistance protein [Medicago truncatula]|uniref:NB-ARC domain disease resistance protein n=2 Tax=Medicago truncatula TaxID=3880 RepID=G7IZW7_MEDTR|nr:NB-ARC domain disease resistance protein [Medicago truncatula]
MTNIRFDAKSLQEQVHKLIEENTETKKRCFFGFCPDCIWRCKRGEELTGKTEVIEKLIETAKKLKSVEFGRRLPEIEFYSGNYTSFKSRELKYKELLDAIKDENNYIIVLQGMAGIGKTTLVEQVFKQLRGSKHFEYAICVTVSFSPDIKKIQCYIAEFLGLKLEDISESDRCKKLLTRLTNGQKILVILDDVWDNLDFDVIGIPNSDNHKRCKVLVTTRNLEVCKKMACKKTIQLDILDEEEAWILFKWYARLTDISSKRILDKGHQIASECKGLPIAIAVLGNNLRAELSREKWDVALKSLQKDASMDDVDDVLVDIYKYLKLSYDYLKDEKAKELFLLCSLFVKDEEISNEILTRFGIGVGLYGEGYDKYKDARSQAVAATKKLLDSILLLETKKGDLKMHGLVHNAAQWIANKAIQRVNLSNKNQKSLVERDNNIKYLLCEGNLKDLFSSEFYGSKLEILILHVNMWGTVDIPISFLGSISGLRVLNLSNKSINLERPTLSLPQSISSLMNIRSLLVERVYLGNISILGSLQSLETLELDHCQIDELPCEIQKLKKLRLLNLEKCEIRSNNPIEVIQRCTSLEELYFCHSFNNFCQEITLPALERYRLSDGFGMMNDSLSKCVSFHHDHFTEATFKHVMQKIELLRLERVKKGWRNLMPEIVPIDQGMNDLIELHLKYDSQLQYLIYIEHIDSQVPTVFSKLVVLHLEEMENLEELCNGPISIDSMNNLEELTMECCQLLQTLSKCSLNLRNLKNMTLKSCPTLVSVFDLSTSRSLLLLESLEIIDCKILENIITCERRVEYDTREEILDGDIDNKSCSSVMFPMLKIVNIQSCPKLQFILPFISDGDLLLLETITIYGCHKLKCIFGQHQDFKFASLKEMMIGDSPNFIDIFPESYHSTLSSIEGSSNSISMRQPQLEPIESSIFSLESISYCLNIWEHAQWLSRPTSYIACHIKVMTLVNVSKIKSVLILSIAPKVLWEILTIRSCDELEQIILDVGDSIGGGNVFPNLKELNVENCDKMEYIVGHIKASDDHQNHNEVTRIHFPALECLKLWSLPSLIGMCTKRYRTTFPPSAVLKLDDCFVVDIKPIGNFTVPSSISRYHDRTTIKVNEISVEKGTSSANAKTITSSNHSKSVNFKTRPSSITCQFPSKPYEGDSSHIEEDLSSSLLVARELEKLVSEKYLNYENFSLLTDFFVKNPSVLLKDTSLSNRYKGYAYNCLAELLKFLQTHNVLDVLGSSHSEFVELLQDWMVLKRLLDSKHIPT